jgi:YidC/Oxa1 family membrane protein insertase
MGDLLHVSCHAVRQLAARPWTPVDVLPERHADGPAAASGASGTGATTTAGEAPAAAAGAAPATTAPAAQAQLVKFSTDVYDGEIDTRGGTLAKLTLKKQGDGKQPDLYITLFDHTAGHTYLARTGLLGGDFPNHNDVYTQLNPGATSLTGDQNTLKLSFESPVKGGVKVVKTYTFTRGSYVIGVDTKIDNVGTAPVTPTVYMELVRDNTAVETPMFSHTFLGPAVYTNAKHFQKINFSDLDKNKADYVNSADNGWVAMVQHYFASAWIPQQGVKRDIYAEKIDPSLYRVGVKQPVAAIAPGQSADVQARLFAGPEEERMLEGIAPGLELVKDYGWVTIIAKPLFWLLEKIHGVVGNWGWAIVLLTMLIKAVFFPLSAASYKSMAR